jgi:hypothetical protein
VEVKKERGGEKANLDHEALDDAVEARAAKVEGLAGELADALLARAQGAEVLGRLGRDIRVELEDHAADWVRDTRSHQRSAAHPQQEEDE